jgi:hypothetical protein
MKQGDHDLRALAAGQACQIRLPEVCVCRGADAFEGDCVLAHLQKPAGVRSPVRAAGMKASDLHAALACFGCHNEVDGRTQRIKDRDYVELAHLHGVIRTQIIWLRMGILKW